MSLTTPTVNSSSGYWNNILGFTAQPDYSMYAGQARHSIPYHVARLFNKGAMRDARAALAALIGAAAGSTATNQWKRRGTIPTPTALAALGGAIPIETATAINRATTSADVAELKKWFNTALLEAGITYPTVMGNNVAKGTQVGGTGRF